MQVILNMTRNTYDSELQWKQCSEYQNQFRSYASSWAPAKNLLNVGNDTIFISGVYSHATRIVDLVINETGELGMFSLLFPVFGLKNPCPETCGFLAQQEL